MNLSLVAVLDITALWDFIFLTFLAYASPFTKTLKTITLTKQLA